MHLLRTRTLFLAYHGVAPDAEEFDAWTLVRASAFRAQMEFLKENFDCISMDQALEGRREGCRRPGAVVTFDDGYANNLEVALPILTDLGIPATIYVVTGIVQERELLWPDAIWFAAKRSGVTDIDLSGIADPLGSYRFGTAREDWQEGVLEILEDVKRTPSEVRRETVEKIAARFMAQSTTGNKVVQVEGNVFSPLKEDEIRELAASPLISLGAHTHCHSLLDRIPLDAARESIEKSKRILEDMTGKAIDHFAYPNGNFNRDIVRIVQEAGFRSAVTWETGYFKPEDDPFAIKRFGVGADTSPEAFKALVSGLLTIRKMWVG
jgi:peptidoglycan/xylan/chitin deacetylase (PgdA/CDA1 family)